LPLVLKIGKKIMVRDENGRSSEGSVVSISDKQLVISRQGFFLRRMEYTFARDVVRRIDLVDSTWDGGGIGAAAGLGLWGLSHAWERATTISSAWRIAALAARRARPDAH
jgi:hypothetical protein